MMGLKKKQIPEKESQTKESSTTFPELSAKAPLTSNHFEAIKTNLVKNHPTVVIDAMINDEARQELFHTIVDDCLAGSNLTPSAKEKVAHWVLAETVGTGFVEKLLRIPDVTDIGWNGRFITVETPNQLFQLSMEQLGLDPEKAEAYILQVVQKFANAVGKSFNENTPDLDSSYKNVRMNAKHASVSPSGTTFSMRVIQPKLVLTRENWETFAPDFVLDFLELMMKTGGNVTISGVTGTGKTELQKLLFSLIPNRNRVIAIEDTEELFLQKLYPEKDIYSWITNKTSTIADHVKSSLRNNPDWVVVSETRGAEAFEMLQGMLTGHFVVTTLHATDVEAIPRRFITMCQGLYKLDESTLLNDILTYFDFGIQIKKAVINGQVIRYLAQMMEFSPEGNTLLFQQELLNGEFFVTCGEASLSDRFQKRMKEKSLPVFTFPIKEREKQSKRKSCEASVNIETLVTQLTEKGIEKEEISNETQEIS